MKNTQTPLNLASSEIKREELIKKRKNYTEQLFQFLSRETNSDKRTNIFGVDPFK